MSKRAASKATSCPEKAPRCSVVNDDEFQSLPALQHTTPLSGCTFNKTQVVDNNYIHNATQEVRNASVAKMAEIE